MSGRERLAMTLHLSKEPTEHMRWLAAYQWVEENGWTAEWRQKQADAYRQADAILASDWLRDTLAAERRAGFIAGRDAAAKVAGNRDNIWPNATDTADAIAAAIRNLEPEASDEI